MYRLLGYEGVRLSQSEVENLVRQGVLTRDTKVVREGETFAAALGARPEFKHLRVGRDDRDEYLSSPNGGRAALRSGELLEWSRIPPTNFGHREWTLVRVEGVAGKRVLVQPMGADGIAPDLRQSPRWVAADHLRPIGR